MLFVATIFNLRYYIYDLGQSADNILQFDQTNTLIINFNEIITSPSKVQIAILIESKVVACG